MELEEILKWIIIVIAAQFILVIVFWIVKCLRVVMYKRKMQRRIESVRLYRKKQFESLKNKLEIDGVLVTEERAKLLNMSAEELIQQMQNGILNVIEVLQAFQAKALEVTENCNCVVDFIVEAEEWATSLEKQPNKNFPLFGLPVSLKEDIGVKGHNVTLGLTKFIENAEQKDGALVQSLKKLGAIPFCRTNLPQMLLSTVSCNNPIYGETTNPLDKTKCPGGSTGGEAALIASGGSLLGFGSDMAGSVRVPAHFCGIASLKPTKLRMSCFGQAKNFDGAIGLGVTAGILGNNVDTVTTAARALFSSSLFHGVDPAMPPLIWREEILHTPRKLRVGYFMDNDFAPEVPSCRRALRETLEALKNSGHEIIDFNNIPKGELIRAILYSMRTVSDCTPTFLNCEPWDKRNIVIRFPSYVPRWLQNIGLWASQLGSRGIRKYILYRGFSSSDVWYHLMNREKLIQEVIQQWRTLKLDVVLTCAYPIPAVKPKYWNVLYSSLLFVTFWNYLNFPAGVVPVTKQTEEDTEDLKTQFLNGTIIRELFAMTSSDSVGLPVGVQVVGLPWEEEMVLRAMKEIEGVLKLSKKTQRCDLEVLDETKC